MCEQKFIRWVEKDSNGEVHMGQMPAQRIQENLRVYESKARRMLAETGADHVTYGIMCFNEDGDAEQLALRLQPMDDERYSRYAAGMENVTVYAVHKKWFAATKWSPKDVIAAAKAQGVTLTEEVASDWWELNECWFQHRMLEYGLKMLSEVEFKKGEGT